MKRCLAAVIFRAAFYIMEDTLMVFAGGFWLCIYTIIQEMGTMIEPWRPPVQTGYKNVT